MTELIVMCVMFLAMLLLHVGGARPWTRRALALGLTALALWLWYRVEPGPSAFVAVSLAAMVSAIACALLAPLARTVLWVSAAVSVLVIIGCWTLGAAP